MLKRNIGILGANNIGATITEVTVVKGYNLFMVDNLGDNLDKGMALIKKNLGGRVTQKQMKNEEKERLIENLKTSTNIGDLKSADFVIEAMSKNFDETSKNVSKIESVVNEDCIIGIQTPYQSIEKIAEVAERPAKVTNFTLSFLLRLILNYLISPYR